MLGMGSMRLSIFDDFSDLECFRERERDSENVGENDLDFSVCFPMKYSGK